MIMELSSFHYHRNDSTFMAHTLETITALIEGALTETLSPYQEPAKLYEPINYTLEGGGKRLRPVLTLLGTEIVGGDVTNSLSAAIALEVFHNFTLLHDDVMDHSDLRRGRASVPAKFGVSRAILSGDTMFALAFRSLTTVPSAFLPETTRFFSDMAIAIMEGQQWDMEFEERDDVTREEYMKMIRNKTAVLLASALQIGSYIGGASDEVVAALYEVGIDMGLAFQLRDDYLDVYGDEKTFGKPIGGDIEENKQTWLLIKAREIAEQRGETELFQKALALPSTDKEKKYNAVRALYDNYQIADLVEQEIAIYSQRAETTLMQIPNLQSEPRELLCQLIRKMAGRTL